MLMWGGCIGFQSWSGTVGGLGSMLMWSGWLSFQSWPGTVGGLGSMLVRGGGGGLVSNHCHVQ